MSNALALGFNRGQPIQTFQSIVDGATAVRGAGPDFAGDRTAQLPTDYGLLQNFLAAFGYFHLYAGDEYDPSSRTRGLGTDLPLDKVAFKTPPGVVVGTIAATDAILSLMQREHLTPEGVAASTRVTPTSST